MSDHILQTYDRDLYGLRDRVVNLARLVHDQLREALKIMAASEDDLATALIDHGSVVAANRRDLELQATGLLTRHAPVADDLRLVVAAIKMGFVLERVGAFTSSIAKRSLAMSERDDEADLARSIVERIGLLKNAALRTIGLQSPSGTDEAIVETESQLGKLVCERLDRAITAYAERNVDSAVALWQAGHEVDRQSNACLSQLITDMVSDVRSVPSDVHLLFVTRNLERIGDYATTVAEITRYEIAGEMMEGGRPRVDDLVPAANGTES